MKMNGYSRLFVLLLGLLLLFGISGCLTTQKKVAEKQPVDEVPFEVYQCSLSSDKKTYIRCERLGTGSPRTAVLFIGSMVGNEPAGTPLLRDLSSFLRQNIRLTEGRRIILVPLLNPYGVENDIRENANGVYINGNFASESSELETILVKKLIYEHNPRLIVSIRQLGIIDPDGPPESKAIAETMARYCNLPIVDKHTTKGSLGYYAGDQKGIPVVTFGLPRNAERRATDRLCGQYIKPLIAAALYPTELSSVSYEEPSCLTVAANDTDNMEEHQQSNVASYDQKPTDWDTMAETPDAQSATDTTSVNASSSQSPDDEIESDHQVTVTDEKETESASHSPGKGESPPVDAAPIIKTATEMFQAGRYAEAQDEFRKALAVDTECGECGDYITKSKTAADLIEQGNAHLEAQRFEEAVNALNGVLSLNPLDAKAKRLLGKARYGWALDLFENGEYDPSKRLFEIVKANHPEACPDCPEHRLRIEKRQFDDLLNRGIDLYNASRYREAVQILEQATELAPDSKEAREYLSKAHFQLAVEFCRKKDPMAAKHLSAFRKVTDCQSCQAMEGALKKEYAQKGERAFYNDKYSEAISLWELVRCLDPDYPEIETNIKAAQKIRNMTNGGERE